MTIEERMTRLERQVRRMKWAVLILGLVLVVGIGWQSRVLSPSPAHGQNPRIVEAEEFHVVDENGKVRALLDSSYLVLYDEKGKGRAGLRVVEDGSALVLQDENGEVRVGLSVDKDEPGLSLYDENGRSRAVLSMFKDEPGLSLYDENEKLRVGLVVSEDGSHLVLQDENGKFRAMLCLFKDGPGLVLFDENETGRAVLGSTSIEVTKTGTIEKRAPSSLVLVDKDGKVIFEAP